MKHILAPILLLVFLFPSLALGEEDANKITSNTNNILEQIANETDGKSVLEFNRFSSYEEISRTYQCEEYKPKDNPRLINSTGDWITHICTKKDIKLLLQVQKNGGISVLRAIYPQTKNTAETNVTEVSDLIGKPNSILNAREGSWSKWIVSYVWGEWGRYDEHNIETYPQYYFRIDLYESDSDDDRYSVRKTLVNNEHVKKYATFNREVIWDGVWSVIGWLFYFLIWWVIFKYHSKNLEKEDLNRARWVVVRERFFTLLKIVAVCGIFTLVVGQGGEMCSSTDMFGCSEYSGEYRESWSGDQKWETFVKILGVTLFAWIMALKGYKIEGGRGSYWR